MQCSSCRAVYSNGLDICPRCKTPAIKSSVETQAAAPIAQPAETKAHAEQAEAEQASAANTDSPTEMEVAPPPVSTLIEFPGVSRNKPQWRKELSERVREIQERRAREAAREMVAPARQATEQLSPSPQLGLVPQPDAPAVNPIVAAALKRLERARQPPPVTRTRATMGGAAAAVARVADEQYQLEENQEPQLGALSVPAPQPQVEQLPEEMPAEPTREREHTLVVVAPKQPLKPATPTISKAAPQPASMKDMGEESLYDSDETMPVGIAAAEPYDDRARMVSRVVGSFIDLLVVAFASSPFAAIIELTNGDWSDIRVSASMGGIIVTIMFLYLAASTALAGRTWGMSLLSIRAVDADSGLPPTTKQAVGRALLYMLSLVSFGLGILYALFDAEGRTAHDHLSGTAVVRE